jgi:hypothetical protein
MERTETYLGLQRAWDSCLVQRTQHLEDRVSQIPRRLVELVNVEFGLVEEAQR